jgi:hypothetical protein
MRLHKKVPSLAEEELDPLVSAQANDDVVWTRLARVRKASAPLSQRGMTQPNRHNRWYDHESDICLWLSHGAA